MYIQVWSGHISGCVGKRDKVLDMRLKQSPKHFVKYEASICEPELRTWLSGSESSS